MLLIVLMSGGVDLARAQAADQQEATAQATADATSDAASRTLEQLGYASGVELSGLFAEQEFFIPDVRGTEASALELDVLPAPTMPPGIFTVSVEDRIQHRAAVPSQRTTIRVPISDVQPAREPLRVQIATAFEGQDVCEAYALYHVNVMPASRVIFANAPVSPSTIASFFLPFVERVIYRVPSSPSVEASETGLRLAAFLARRYPGSTPEIEATSRSAPDGSSTAGDAWTQTVIFEPGSRARLAQQPDGTVALVIGSIDQAEQLFSTPNGMDAAVTSSLSTDSIRIQNVREFGERVSLAELGYTAHRVRGIGTIVDRYDFALADFGMNRRPSGIRLVVRHSPLVEYASGYMTIDVNDVAIEHLELEGTVVDRYIRIPEHVLRRDNEMEVRFEYSPPQGECSRGQLPFSATVDPGSTILVEDGAVMSGLDAFPQSLLPAFDVRLVPNNVENLQAAIQLLAAMQRTTRAVLSPRVVDNEEDAGDAALLIVSDGPVSEEYDPVLAMDGFRLTERDGTVLLSFTPETPYHAIQAFERDGRDVLMVGRSGATAADAETNRAFMEELLGEEGWFQVHGDVAVRGPQGRVSSISLEGDALQVRPLEASSEILWQQYRVWIYLAVALLVLLGFIWLYPNVVRRQPR